MDYFDALRISGFRRLADVELQLRPLTVLIGANGVGKTSVLDALNLLSASARGELRSKVSEFGGLGAMRTYDQTEGAAFGLTMSIPERHALDYDLVLQASGNGYAIDEETLTRRRGDVAIPYIEATTGDVRYLDAAEHLQIRPDWDYSPSESALSQVPRNFREPERFRKILASMSAYHALDVRARAPIRTPQPMQPASLPGVNGEDLVSCLYYLRETDSERFETVQATLRSAFPGFTRLEFPPAAAGTLALAWRDENFSKPVYAHQLSEGTLRFLWLVTLLQSPEIETLTLIDEPEVSLHPELLSLLAELLREASDRTQLIVATHSDRLVRFLQPSEVVVMDVEDDGTAVLTWADRLDLLGWLNDYTLDQVWRLGRMGGRP